MTKSKLIKTRKPKFQLYTFNKFNFNITFFKILIYFITSNVLLILSQNLQPKKYWKLIMYSGIYRKRVNECYIFILAREKY